MALGPPSPRPALLSTRFSSWSTSTSLFRGEASLLPLPGRCGEGRDDLREDAGGGACAGGEVGERIGEVGETMSGTGDNSRFSKLGLRLRK